MERSANAKTYRDTPIPGTTVFTGSRSQQGYRINKLAMSLTEPANRESFRADERGYMGKYGLSEAEMHLIERRDCRTDCGRGQRLLALEDRRRGRTESVANGCTDARRNARELHADTSRQNGHIRRAEKLIWRV